MGRKVINYKSSLAGVEIHAIAWIPDEGITPIGIVQICHGMAEYVELYNDFAGFLNKNGFIVCAHDQLGHGKTAAGTYGYFGKKKGHRYLARDVFTLTLLMKREYPDIPYILLGHSMGSFIARYVCSLWGMEYDGAIYSGTGNAKGYVRLARMLLSLRCKLGSGEKECKFFPARIDKRLEKKYKGKGWYSRDEELVAKLTDDPQFGFYFTNYGYRDMMKLYELVSSHRWYDRMPKDLPLLMISGKDDPVGSYGKGVNAVYQRLLDAGCEDVTLKMYEDGRHDLILDINSGEVYDDILDWIIKSILN